MNQIKVLAVALLTTFAIGAISVAAAQAVPEFHSELKETLLFGEQEVANVFSTTAGKVKCKGATYESLNAQKAEGGGAGNWTSKMWAVQPQWTSCVAFGQAATADNPPAQTGTACDFYLFADTATVTTTGTPLPATAGADVACEIKVTVPAGNCNLVINQQSAGKPKVSFENVLFEGSESIKTTWAVEEIAYTVEGAKGSVCGEPGVHKDGKYEGTAVLRGYEKAPFVLANQVEIWWK